LNNDIAEFSFDTATQRSTRAPFCWNTLQKPQVNRKSHIMPVTTFTHRPNWSPKRYTVTLRKI